MKQDHEEKYQSLLKEVIQSGPIVEPGAAAEEETAIVSGTAGNSEAEMKTFANVEELQHADGPFGPRCSSEVSGVEIIKGKSGKIYLLSDKARIIPKHTLIGGYGTGKTIGCNQFVMKLCKSLLFIMPKVWLGCMRSGFISF